MDKLTNKRTLVISWDAMMAFLVAFICLGGVTYFPDNLRLPLMIFTITGTAILTRKLYVTRYCAAWFVIIALVTISILFSYDKSMTLFFSGLYFLSAFLLCFSYTDHFWDRLLRIMGIFTLVIAISIVISTFIENFVLDYLWFIVNPRQTLSVITRIQNELNRGSYSGLAGEQAQAAVIMNVGIAIKLSKIFSGSGFKKKDIGELILYFIALILTGKRMLFFIPLLAGTAALLMSKMKYKIAKFLFLIIGLAAALELAYTFIPEMEIMYERLLGNIDSIYYDPLTRRGELWDYSIRMFFEKPIFGQGFGSFNTYAYEHGYLRDGQKWNYFGHNCYLQLLGETGLVGTVLILGMFLYPLIFTIRSFKHTISANRKYCMLFSFYLQLMLFIYCTSANVLYYKEQIFLWFVAIAMAFSMQNQQAERIQT